ncbi:MAG TPA: pitrilysin family protein, partial [Pseudobdellovibrionaceae bacterium]|nr:pitrilysin family protein [Pseudobdellovibrionaceae bacterium]
DFKLEKSVIVQEIGMSEDQPEELIYDRFFEEVYKGNGLSIPIAGTVKSVLEMKMRDLQSYYKEHFKNEKLIISLTGDVSFSDVVKECNIRFGRTKKQKGKKIKPRLRPQWRSFHQMIEKKIDHSHVLLGLPSTSFKSAQRFESLIMNALLGGGMTSRLYQAIREKRGLVYSIYSQLVTHSDSGAFMFYASSETESIARVTKLMLSEVTKLKKKTPSQKELDHFKTQVIGQVKLNSDDIENRMNSIAINEIIFQDYKSVDWVVSQIENVSLSSINQWKNEFLDLSQLSGILITSDGEKNKKWWNSLFSESN